MQIKFMTCLQLTLIISIQHHFPLQQLKVQINVSVSSRKIIKIINSWVKYIYIWYIWSSKVLRFNFVLIVSTSSMILDQLYYCGGNSHSILIWLFSSVTTKGIGLGLGLGLARVIFRSSVCSASCDISCV